MLRVRNLLFVLLSFLFIQACSFSDEKPAADGNSNEEGDSWYEVSLRGSIFGSVTEKEVNDALPAKFISPEMLPKFVERGRYLTSAAACGSCHAQNPKSPKSPLSGGPVIRDRFGPVRAANITSANPAGIGGWSLREIGSAIRASLGKNGRPLSLDVHSQYRWLADVDTLAIAAYLRSLPPVKNEVERRELGTFERNSMGLVSRHQAIFGYVPSPATNNPREYGRYLVHNVANCVSCHTPDGGLFSDGEMLSGRDSEEDAERYPRGGGDLRGSSKEGLKSWKTGEIIRYLETGMTARNKKIDGGLCPWPYYQGLTAKDKQAIAEYLKGI